MNIIPTRKCSLKFPVSLFAVFLGLFAALPAFGQAIETEFWEEAQVNWLELRKKTFNSSAIAVENSIKELRLDPDSKEVQTRTITTRYIQFTQGEFKYYESIPLTDTNSRVEVPFNRRHVKIHNPKQTFLISKDPETKWVLRDVENSPGKFIFDPESIKGNRGQRQPARPLTALTQALGQDPRLMTDRNSAIEGLISGYLEYDEDSFRNFNVSTDVDIGRVVTVELACKVDLKERPQRRPTNAVKLTVDGEFKFLADWSWLPISIKMTHREFDKVGNELQKTTKTFKADYDSKQVENARKLGIDLIPQRVVITSKSEPDQNDNEIVYTIRSLNADEIESIQATQSLADFDLKDQE